MSEYIYTCNVPCVVQKSEQTKANPKSGTGIWNNLWLLIGTIGAYAVEIYPWNNDVQPQISQGGVRVLIRPDRIDLV